LVVEGVGPPETVAVVSATGALVLASTFPVVTAVPEVGTGSAIVVVVVSEPLVVEEWEWDGDGDADGLLVGGLGLVLLSGPPDMLVIAKLGEVFPELPIKTMR